MRVKAVALCNVGEELFKIEGSHRQFFNGDGSDPDGSIETFMRMVEQGAGVTFLPELALSQLTSEQKQLVRPLAMPVPVREVVLSVAPDFVRRRMASLLETAVKESVPQEMLRFRNTHVRI